MEIFFFLTYLMPYDLTDLFSYCNRFYFTQNILRKLFYSNAGTSRFACEVFFIDCIKCSKICHISKEACCLYNIVKCKTSFFKDRSNIFAGLLSLSLDLIPCNFAGCRIYRNLAGCEYKISCHFSLRIWSNCCRCFLSFKCFHEKFLRSVFFSS